MRTLCITGQSKKMTPIATSRHSQTLLRRLRTISRSITEEAAATKISSLFFKIPKATAAAAPATQTLSAKVSGISTKGTGIP